jgi:histidine triad (HIT) family protein
MENCIFCQVAKGESPSWKVYENEDVYAFLDINPASRYHTLIIPKAHYINIFDIPEKELKALITAVRKLARLYKEKLGINNIQIVCSSGAEAQQDVFHIHFHLVPRCAGDGQNIQWTTHREWRSDFDDMLHNLKES